MSWKEELRVCSFISHESSVMFSQALTDAAPQKDFLHQYFWLAVSCRRNPSWPKWVSVENNLTNYLLVSWEVNHVTPLCLIQGQLSGDVPPYRHFWSVPWLNKPIISSFRWLNQEILCESLIQALHRTPALLMCRECVCLTVIIFHPNIKTWK